MTMSMRILAAAALLASGLAEAAAADLSPDEARAIAKEAYIYGFPMVDSYRIQYAYFVDKADPEYKTGWNQLYNTARVYTRQSDHRTPTVCPCARKC